MEDDEEDEETGEFLLSPPSPPLTHGGVVVGVGVGVPVEFTQNAFSCANLLWCIDVGEEEK